MFILLFPLLPPASDHVYYFSYDLDVREEKLIHTGMREVNMYKSWGAFGEELGSHRTHDPHIGEGRDSPSRVLIAQQL